MKKTTVTERTSHPCDVVDDPLTEVLRSGAQRLLVKAIEAEAEAFLALMADWKLKDGRARFVRHGPIFTNLGPSVASRLGSAPDRTTAEKAINIFAEKYGPKYGPKYDKAVHCLVKDWEQLLAFFDFPAEHWDHIRTSNPIESVFATVRHRTVSTKGSLSKTTAKLMAFKLIHQRCRGRQTFNQRRRLAARHTNPRIALRLGSTAQISAKAKELPRSENGSPSSSRSCPRSQLVCQRRLRRRLGLRLAPKKGSS